MNADECSECGQPGGELVSYMGSSLKHPKCWAPDRGPFTHLMKKFPFVVGHITRPCKHDQIWCATEEAASKFIGEVLRLVDPEGVARGDYYIDNMNDPDCDSDS